MNKKTDIELECLVCGDHITGDPSKRIMCKECGNGIYAPAKTCSQITK